MKTKTMQSLNIEGRHIKLYPGDSVKKWGKIVHVTTEGLIVLITKVGSTDRISSSYVVGMESFIPWGKVSFRFEETPKGEKQ